MEVARLELIHTETHVKLGDLLHTSGRGTNQQGSEEHYLQGCLYRDQHLLDKASEQLTQAHDLIQELISPELQELLGVTLTIHGEVLNREAQRHTPGQSRIRDSRAALEKQQKAVRIFSQLERSISGPLLSSTRRKLMETSTSMADTLETLELHT